MILRFWSKEFWDFRLLTAFLKDKITWERVLFLVTLQSYSLQIFYKYIMFLPFSCQRIVEYAGPIIDTGGMGAFFRVHLFKKGAFCLLAPPEQMLILTIFNEHIFFFKTLGSRLDAIVAPNKSLKLVLIQAKVLSDLSKILQSVWFLSFSDQKKPGNSFVFCCQLGHLGRLC